MANTPLLKLPYLAAAQAQKHVTHNEALRALDALVQLAVRDRDLTAPPSSLTDGDRFVVAAGASGAWSGQTSRIAAWQDGAWSFHAPVEGWVAWVADEDVLIAWDGGSWVETGGSVPAAIQHRTMVGVGTTADATNRLAVASPASLFSHEGNGHQVKVNKHAAADTASLLFQTDWSGRAEIGLAGDDNFHFKVSPDGSAWHEAIVVDRATGVVSFPAGTDADYGFDVILLAGQSNMVGYNTGIDALLDWTDPRILAWGGSSGYLDKLVLAKDPLEGPDVQAGSVGLALSFAKAYADALPPHRRVLLVPAAHGGTGLVSSTWAAGTPAGGVRYEFAIARANAAIAAHANNRLAAILWLQGEADAGQTQSAYAAALDAMIAGFRARITGAATVPVVIGRMVPENIAATAGLVPIDAAHIDTPRRLTRAGFWYGPTGAAVAGNIHYTAAGCRENGLRAYLGYLDALANVTGAAPLVARSVAAAQTSPTSIAVTWLNPRSRVTGYKIDYRVQGTTPWTTVTRAVLDLAYTITGLTPGTTYDVRVTAFNEAGDGPASGIVTAATPLIPVATPAFSPVAGSYTGTQTVTISCATAGATIHYTTDGSTPTTASPVYSAPLSVAATTTVKALAVKAGMADSAVASATFVIAAISYLYDALSGGGQSALLMAYSVRKLGSAYAGAAMRVRRSSDDTEQDIGFTAGGNLDTTALLAFAGAGSAYVKTWYDQSGGGHNATQATTSKQPRIVNAGALETINGVAAPRWTGSEYLAASGLNPSVDCAIACAASASGTFQNFLSADNDGGLAFWLNADTKLSLFAEGVTAPSAFPTNTLKAIATKRASGVSSLYIGGSSVASSAAAATAPTNVLLGSFHQAFILVGFIPEMLTFSAALSNTDIAAIATSETTAFSIT